MKANFKKIASVMLVIAVMLSVVVPCSVTTVSAATITADNYINYAQLPYEEGAFKSPYDDEAEAKRLEILNSPNVLQDESGGVDVGMVNNLDDTRMVYCSNAASSKTFAQYVGAKQNGVEIKPNTTYVMSFDVYAQSTGTLGTKRFKLSYGFKSLNTGHNSTYPEANMWMKSSGGATFSNGYTHASIEFTTIDNQTDFIYAIESGDQGKAYLWNFELVEKGTTENLLTYSSLIFETIDDMQSDVLGGYGWHITKNSVYSLVNFVNEYGALEGSAAGTTTNKTLTYITYKDPDVPPRAYYISNDGNDNNAGNTPDAPWKSLSKLEGIKGLVYSPVTIFLERGSTFRGRLPLYSYTNYAAYGEGEKPKIYGSAQNYKNVPWTQNSTYPNVWELSMSSDIVDVGSIVFNHGEKVGFRIISTTKSGSTITHDSLDTHFAKMFQDKYNKDLTFIYYNQKVYLRSDSGNPATQFESIEITTKGSDGGSIMYNPNGLKLQDVTIENLCLKYGNFGIVTGSGGSNNVTMRNLEIGYIGGCLQNETIRYGNGIEVWANSTYVTIEDCWVYQCYDAGISNQCSTNIYAPNVYNYFDHITFDGNLIEFCQYNIEFFNSANEGSYCHNMNYTNNILRFAGYQVFDPKERLGSNSSYTALINSNGTAHDFGGSYLIEGNIFDTSYGYVIKSGEFNTNTGAMVRGNTYLQQPQLPTYFFGMGADNYPIVPTISGAGGPYDWKHIGNQFVMEELIAAIDTDPKTVTFMSNADTGNYLIKCDETTVSGATYTLTDTVTNGTVNFVFDCYLNGNDGDAVIVNLATGDTLYTLKGGKNACNFTTSYSGSTQYAIKILNNPTKMRIYLDNVNITSDGTDVFNPYAKQQVGAPICITVFEEDMAYDTEFLEREVDVIQFTNAKANCRVYLADMVSSTSSKEISISFKYSLAGTTSNKEIYVANTEKTSVAHPDAVTGSQYLLEGEHTYSYSTTSYTVSSFYPAIRPAAGSNATLRIWDVEITVDGKASTINIEVPSSYQQYASYFLGKYSDALNSQKAYLIDFNNATRKCISLNKNFSSTRDENITISFDYYLAGAEDEEIVLSNVAGGAFADNDLNTAKLYKGRNHLTYTNEHYGAYDALLLDLRAYDSNTSDGVEVTTNAKIYIWNVRVLLNGVDVFSTAVNSTYDKGDVTITKMTVGDVPFRGDSNNDGKVNVLDLIRLKRHLLGEIYVKESQANAYMDHRIDALDIAATKKAILGIKL